MREVAMRVFVMPKFDLIRKNFEYPQRRSLNKAAFFLRKLFEVNELAEADGSMSGGKNPTNPTNRERPTEIAGQSSK
jgi:hypothetical protein